MVKWGRKGRKETSNTLPSHFRGKKGNVGDKTIIYCDCCKRDTCHVLTCEENPHLKYWWKCQECGTKKPGRVR